jgi:hypothetical protein
LHLSDRNRLRTLDAPRPPSSTARVLRLRRSLCRFTFIKLTYRKWVLRWQRLPWRCRRRQLGVAFCFIDFLGDYPDVTPLLQAAYAAAKKSSHSD